MGKLTKKLFNEYYDKVELEDQEVYSFLAADNHRINVLYVDEDIKNSNGTVVAYKGEIYYNDPESDKVWQAQVFEDHSNAVGDTEGYYLLRVTSEKSRKEGEITRIKANKNPKFLDSELCDVLRTNLPNVKEYQELLKETKEIRKKDQPQELEISDEYVESEPVESEEQRILGGDMENNEEKELTQHVAALEEAFGASSYGWKNILQNAIENPNSTEYKMLASFSQNHFDDVNQNNVALNAMLFVDNVIAERKQAEIIAKGDAALAKSAANKAEFARNVESGEIKFADKPNPKIPEGYQMLSNAQLEKAKNMKIKPIVKSTGEEQEVQGANQTTTTKKSGKKGLITALVLCGVLAAASLATGIYVLANDKDNTKEPPVIAPIKDQQTKPNADTIATAGNTVGAALGINVEKTILSDDGKTLYVLGSDGIVSKVTLKEELKDGNVATALGTEREIQKNTDLEAFADKTNWLKNGKYSIEGQEFEVSEIVGKRLSYFLSDLGIENDENLCIFEKSQNGKGHSTGSIMVSGKDVETGSDVAIIINYEMTNNDNLKASNGTALLNLLDCEIGDYSLTTETQNIITPKAERIAGTDYAFVAGNDDGRTL